MDYFMKKLFPIKISKVMLQIIAQHQIEPEEIRIRLGQAPVVRSMGQEFVCSETIVSKNDISYILMNATDGGVHTSMDAIRNGYLSLPNGCRLGICGEGVLQDQKIYNFKYIHSLCLRVARENIGCADSIYNTCYTSSFKNTIIIAPPGVGKTTFLRECIRKLSNNKYNVGVADERGEISGMYQGRNSFDLGCRTDVICGIDKPNAASMLLRTMAPDIIAMDEITSQRDLPAIIDAIGCGVSLLATTHGTDLNDLNKPIFKEILKTKAFELAIIIRIQNKERVYITEKLYD